VTELVDDEKAVSDTEVLESVDEFASLADEIDEEAVSVLDTDVLETVDELASLDVEADVVELVVDAELDDAEAVPDAVALEGVLRLLDEVESLAAELTVELLLGLGDA
jgi:hypothetical protein